MSKYRQIKNQDANEDDFFDNMSKEQREILDRAFLAAAESDIREFDELPDNITPPPSRRFKIRMNRLFRERVGGAYLPYPEVDNFYERVRSKLIVKLKINEFLDCRKKRRLPK